MYFCRWNNIATFFWKRRSRQQDCRSNSSKGWTIYDLSSKNSRSFLIVRSWKCFRCIPYQWKHKGRHHTCKPTLCTRGDTHVWTRIQNGGPDGGHNIFVIIFRSWKCLRYILYPWKHMRRHQHCRSASHILTRIVAKSAEMIHLRIKETTTKIKQNFFSKRTLWEGSRSTRLSA